MAKPAKSFAFLKESCMKKFSSDECIKNFLIKYKNMKCMITEAALFLCSGLVDEQNKYG